MKTKLNFISLFLLLALLMSASVANAQNQNLTQTVCISNQPYNVDASLLPNPVYHWSITPGVSGTNWTINGTGNAITIDWILAGVYTLQVYTTADGCDGPPVQVEVTVIPQPVGPTLLAKDPNVASFCFESIPTVSATFNPGTGGVGGVDEFQYRTDGGAWTNYIAGAPISTTGVTTSIEIQGRRNVTTTTGCSPTAWVTLATWNISAALPVSITIVADPNPVCAGASVTFTATAVNGGATPVYAWRVNGATQVGQTASTFTYVPTNGDLVECDVTSSDVCGTPKPATSNVITVVVKPIPTTSPIWHN